MVYRIRNNDYTTYCIISGYFHITFSLKSEHFKFYVLCIGFVLIVVHILFHFSKNVFCCLKSTELLSINILID